MSTRTRLQLLSFFDLHREISFAQNDATRIVRTFDNAAGAPYVEKIYAGKLSNLQLRENDLLFAVAQRQVAGVELSARIAGMTSFAKNASVLSNHSIHVKWYGFDLDDWATLLHEGADDNAAPSPLHQARWLLELARASLHALHLLHAAGYVHNDVHNGNWCLPFSGQRLITTNGGTGHALEFSLDPDALKLIDLGLSLKPSAERGLPPRWQNADGSPGSVIQLNPQSVPSHPKRLMSALAQAQLGNMAPWQALDWRLDLARLGALIDHWRTCASEGNGLAGPKAQRELLANLADWLQRPEAAALAGEPAPQALPHLVFTKAINDLIGPIQPITLQIPLQAQEAHMLQAMASAKPATSTTNSPARAPASPTLAPTHGPASAPSPSRKRTKLFGALIGTSLIGFLAWPKGKREEPPPAPVASAPSAAVDAAKAAAGAAQDAAARYVAAYAGGPVMVALPQATGDVPGTLLGQADSDDANEKPPYRVRVPYKLSMGETEVTFAQWAQCVAEKGCAQTPSDNTWGTGERPVINISWHDTKSYLDWLNIKTGNVQWQSGINHHPNRYRLPTEAEWEYAARAGSDGEFSLGQHNHLALSAATANYHGNSQYKGSPQGEVRNQTLPVKSFKDSANAWDLHDMHGNVWEWVQDCYDVGEYARRQGAGWDARKTSANSADNATCQARVLRGGSWSNGPQILRSAIRNDGGPIYRLNITGFRLTRTLP